MGPRSIDRGTGLLQQQIATLTSASMGPRSIDRGTAIVQAKSLGDVLLQWGRDRSIAELPTVFPADSPLYSLQWGRDRSIAELPPTRRAGESAECFNGAAID